MLIFNPGGYMDTAMFSLLGEAIGAVAGTMVIVGLVVGLVPALLFGKEMSGRIKYKELFSGFWWGILMGIFSGWFWLVHETGSIKKKLYECRHSEEYKNYMRREIRAFWWGFVIIRIVILAAATNIVYQNKVTEMRYRNNNYYIQIKN